MNNQIGSGYRTRVRVAMIPLNYNLRDKSDINELMIDHDNNTIYINNGGLFKKYPDTDAINNEAVEYLSTKGITKGSTNIGSIIIRSSDRYNWVKDIRTTNDDRVGTDDIFKMVKDIDNTSIFMDLMYDKLDKVVGKDLVTNNYTNYYKNKLSTIDKESGVYKHPKEQLCNYEPPVTSVNGKTGEISIYKDDIEGLENVEKNANRYIHPETQQCMHSFTIKSINNKTDSHIIINKNDIGLGNVSNMKLLSYEDIHNNKDGYVTPEDLTKYIDFMMGVS